MTFLVIFCHYSFPGWGACTWSSARRTRCWPRAGWSARRAAWRARAGGGNWIRIVLPGKSILRDYFQENRTSQRPFLLLTIIFPGRPIFIQFIPEQSGKSFPCRNKLTVQCVNLLFQFKTALVIFLPIMSFFVRVSFRNKLSLATDPSIYKQTLHVSSTFNQAK